LYIKTVQLEQLQSACWLL